MNKDNNQDFEGTCPQCQIGRIQQIQRPYLELYRGHLFTVPQAYCYVCDVCDYVEFDTGAVALISHMVSDTASALFADDRDSKHHQPTKSEDDTPKKPLQPPASS